MALVEITSGNVFAGANLRKLEVGTVVEVDDATAERWKASGKAKSTDKNKGEKLFGETSLPVSSQDNDLHEQLAAVTKRAEEAETALAAAQKKAK